MILAGDIGGTKTTLALFEDDRRGAPSVWETYRSSEHATFMDVVRTFVRSHPADIELACVGVAGPVKDNRSQTTNLPWVVDGAELAREARIPQAWLLNDLEAFAYGIEVIRPEDIHELQAGAPDASGNRAVIAAGTGLGEAGLFWNGTRHIPFGTEGGHGDFAPHDELEIDLLRYLLRELEHVSWERVVSGMGILNIYRFLRDTGREEEPAWLAEAMRGDTPPATIADAARNRKVPLCVRTIKLFVKLYGDEAGDLALKIMATGGLYVAGGPARKNLDFLTDGTFLAAFNAKGRMRRLMQSMPVRVILTDQASLIGAAHCAVLRQRNP